MGQILEMNEVETGSTRGKNGSVASRVFLIKEKTNGFGEYQNNAFGREFY